MRGVSGRQICKVRQSHSARHSLVLKDTFDQCRGPGVRERSKVGRPGHPLSGLAIPNKKTNKRTEKKGKSGMIFSQSAGLGLGLAISSSVSSHGFGLFYSLFPRIFYGLNFPYHLIIINIINITHYRSHAHVTKACLFPL